LGPFVAHRGRKLLVDEVFHRPDALAGAVARRRSAVDRGCGIEVVAHDHDGATHILMRAMAPKGTIRPALLRICSCCKSSICLRKFGWACTFTCQVRPNLLKSLT